MSTLGIDIIVPVWNRPVETRACLVSLIHTVPGARFILINNGCDRETESMLEEFAESLDERALLISTDVNLGFVRAVNRGLARGEAADLVIVRNTSQVTQGWLEPLRELASQRPEAGLIVPWLLESPCAEKAGKWSGAPYAREADHGAFAAMVIRKSLYERIGGFDEEMDGGFWCLKDYSRRAYRAGFSTFIVKGGAVCYREEQLLGSAARRAEAERRGVALYTTRWGEDRAFCVYFPASVEPPAALGQWEVMLKGARQGHRFTVIAHGKLWRELVKGGCDRLHENVRIERLPPLFASGALRRILRSLQRSDPAVTLVPGVEGSLFPEGLKSIPFSGLEAFVNSNESQRYGE